MALPAVFGTETEYGIAVRNQADFNPTLASSQVVNAYQGGRVRVQWSFEEETPGKDARGFGYETYGAMDVDTGLVNVVLTNGARFYVDHAHPEYSSPECIDPWQAARRSSAPMPPCPPSMRRLAAAVFARRTMFSIMAPEEKSR